MVRPELVESLEALYAGARLESLAGDASSRRFHRLFLAGGGTRIVMDYGQPFVGETDDIRLARVFERASLPVARILDVMPQGGALVLEDLGNMTMEVALAQSNADGALGRQSLYRSALTLAAGIATRGTEALRASPRAEGPALDADRFRFEMDFFLEHFVGSFLARPEAAAGLREPLYRLAQAVAGHPRVFCHRDYHCRNLMVLPDQSMAMVDIQDARWGPDTYDVASVLRDAYAELGEQEVEEFLEIYRLQLPAAPERDEFRSRFRLVAAQRMIKALGTFGYQVSRLGRDRYRDAIPRTVDRLVIALPRVRELSELAGFFQKLEPAS